MATTVGTYASVEAYYAADERRRWSPELDYGVWWRQADVIARVTWVEATGELIAVLLSGPHVADALVFGEPVTMLSAGTTGAVQVLGVVHGRDVAERLLEGWADVCGAPDSLAWVVGRVREAEV